MQSEYNASTTNYHGSGYSSINHYNSSFEGPGYQNALNNTGNGYVVPDLNSVLNYNTLVKGNSPNGYANIQSAYGLNAENCCPKYKKSACNAPVQCPPCAPVRRKTQCTPFNVEQVPSCV